MADCISQQWLQKYLLSHVFFYPRNKLLFQNRFKFTEKQLCKTISYKDSSLEDDAEFEKLIAKLPILYPNVCKNCSLLRFDGRALLFKWQGKNHNNPSVMMSHYDVVPVDEAGWQKPPFSWCGVEVVGEEKWSKD